MENCTVALSGKLSDLFMTVVDILVITVLSDDRTRDKERIEFVNCAQIHNRNLHPDIILTPQQLHTLFDARAATIKAEIDREGLRAVQEKNLVQIIDRGVQRRVLSSIFAISICDYELHDEERGLIQTALSVWKSQLPDPSEIEPIS